MWLRFSDLIGSLQTRIYNDGHQHGPHKNIANNQLHESEKMREEYPTYASKASTIAAWQNATITKAHDQGEFGVYILLDFFGVATGSYPSRWW